MEEAPSTGPKLLSRMVKLHYDWQYDFLRPTEKELVPRYNEKWHGALVPAAHVGVATPAPAPAPVLAGSGARAGARARARACALAAFGLCMAVGSSFASGLHWRFAWRLAVLAVGGWWGVRAEGALPPR